MVERDSVNEPSSVHSSIQVLTLWPIPATRQLGSWYMGMVHKSPRTHSLVTSRDGMVSMGNPRSGILRIPLNSRMWCTPWNRIWRAEWRRCTLHCPATSSILFIRQYMLPINVSNLRVLGSSSSLQRSINIDQPAQKGLHRRYQGDRFAGVQRSRPSMT